ncbi:MAG: hypothetical protein Q4F12_02420 [Erysipelotrichaceae bacterium]|nr:hypothetical protein [Erysipelotrichaceae bacterium]
MEDKSFRTKYKHDYTKCVPSVYFYYINNEIVYVGKTINGINKRLSEHYHQNDELSKHLNEIHRIDYMQLSSQADMDMCELFYIYKLRPRYNKTIKSYTQMSKELYDSLTSIFSFDKVKTVFNVGTEFFDGDNKQQELEETLKHERYIALVLVAEDICEWCSYDIHRIKEEMTGLDPFITKYRCEFKTSDVENFIYSNINELKEGNMLLNYNNAVLSAI